MTVESRLAKVEAFYAAVEAAPTLEMRGFDNDEFLIHCTLTKHWTKLALSTVLGEDLNVLMDVLTEKRPSSVLIHFTRIVGYYSHVQNWNASKLGELAARRKGSYDIPAVEVEPHAIAAS